MGKLVILCALFAVLVYTKVSVMRSTSNYSYSTICTLLILLDGTKHSIIGRCNEIDDYELLHETKLSLADAAESAASKSEPNTENVHFAVRK